MRTDGQASFPEPATHQRMYETLVICQFLCRCPVRRVIVLIGRWKGAFLCSLQSGSRIKWLVNFDRMHCPGQDWHRCGPCLAREEAVGSQAGDIELDADALAVLQRSLQQQAVGVQAALRIADHPSYKHCRLLHHNKCTGVSPWSASTMSEYMRGILRVGVWHDLQGSTHKLLDRTGGGGCVASLFAIATTGEEFDQTPCIAPKICRDQPSTQELEEANKGSCPKETN